MESVFIPNSLHNNFDLDNTGIFNQFEILYGGTNLSSDKIFAH